jgi:hypothetical protein
MDTLNNSVAAHSPQFETWEDVVRWAREKIVEAAEHNGDGQDERAFWYNKPSPNWRPDFSDVPIRPIEKGGPEHRYAQPATDQLITEPIRIADASGPPEAPLDRPVASWTHDDLRAVMNSAAYLQSRHPRQREAAGKVREWFERRFGTGPVRMDATGRGIPSVRGSSATAGACPVAVRAHSRSGGKVEVGPHCRSMPAA